MAGDCASRQSDYIGDRFAKIKTMVLRRRFFDVITNPFDDVSGTIDITDDTVERFSDPIQVWWSFVWLSGNNLNSLSSCI